MYLPYIRPIHDRFHRRTNHSVDHFDMNGTLGDPKCNFYVSSLEEISFYRFKAQEVLYQLHKNPVNKETIKNKNNN